jgi:putative SOS response-associated peptidase YedK
MTDELTRQSPPAVYTDGPGKIAQVMIWGEGQPRQVELRWGLRPFEPGGRSVSLLRAEGRAITDRCLIIANDFYLRPGTAPGNKRRRVELITSAPFFCFAGTWRAEMRDWPASFAGITVEAYPDIAPFQDRHIAVVREDDWMDWLEGSRPAESILRPFPPGTFKVSGPPPPASGDLFAD